MSTKKRVVELDDHYGLTDAEWAIAEILHEGCWCEPEQELYAEEGQTYDGCGPWSRGQDARRILAAIDGPEPTWRDVFKAARREGWTRQGGRYWVMWGVWGTEDIDDSHGWIVAHIVGRTRRVTVVGPGHGPMQGRPSAELIDPTPAQVLTVARALGLGGDSDA